MSLNNSNNLFGSSIGYNYIILRRRYERNIIVDRRIRRRNLSVRRRIRIYERRAQVDNQDTLNRIEQITKEKFVNQMFNGSSFY
ncbi:uncharacterized protein OCT59_015211 [Rhizophagus irregularis]|uniref:uncharacterized protein n=1 Tax=Rhizophagus irregularis TaxID=588596 RepID=UPI0033340532|nr:hypothetical protein OCT59_015211 [Rhizophagus irregularis]